jgi:hypothetical protein
MFMKPVADDYGIKTVKSILLIKCRHYFRFEVFMAVKVSMVVFWVVPLCGVVGGCST